jgi:hypothetical protein
MISKSIIVLDPTASPIKKQLEMAFFPDRLEGGLIGLLWNHKPGGDVLLNRFGERLNERFHFAEILMRMKPHSACGVDECVSNEFLEKCDLVIIGLGD